MKTYIWQGLAGALALFAWPLAASAQQVNVATPFSNNNSSFFEQMGVSFGGHIGNNAFFNNGVGGNAGGVRPPFGGGNNGGGANFGFGIHGNGFGANFGFFGDTGYSASSSSITPSVTVQNGGTGAIFSGQQRPFVTGLVPLVGAFSPGVGYTELPPRYTSPLVERLARIQEQHASGAAATNTAPTAARDEEDAPAPRAIASSAERGEQSLSAIRAQKQAANQAKLAEVEAILEAARAREAAGQPAQALLDYQRAAKRADGELKQQIQAKIAELRAKK